MNVALGANSLNMLVSMKELPNDKGEAKVSI